MLQWLAVTELTKKDFLIKVNPDKRDGLYQINTDFIGYEKNADKK